MDARDPALGADEAGVQHALRLLSKALAAGTDPSGEGYAGDPYLDRLRAQGRAEHPFGGTGDTYIGYQSLATLLDLSDGHPPFSARFMRVVGTDMVAYDREHRPGNPLPRTLPAMVSPYVPGIPHRTPTAPMPDLTGLLHLGWALTPAGDRATAAPPANGRTDFLTGLLHAAGLGRAGSQALLNHTAAGQKNSDLEYLLHERRALWAYTDHGTRLGQTMKAAMSGHDATSQRLFKETSELLGRDTRRYFTYDKDHHLRFTDTDGHADDLSGLRPSLGDILNGHLRDVEDAFFGDVSGGGSPRGLPSPRDIDALLAEAAQNDEVFTGLVKNGVGRLRALLDRQYAGGKGIDDVLIAEGGLMGHLLAMRREALVARGVTVDLANQQIKGLIDKGIGLVPVPYAKLFGGAGAGVYRDLADREYGEIGEWLFQQTRQDGGSAERDSAVATDEQTVRKLLRQMSLSAAIDHFNAAGRRALGEPFADRTGRILAPSRWNDDSAASRFVEWCEENDFPAPRMSQSLETTIRNSHDDAVSSFNGANEMP
jgi:hypothetical protein